MIEKLSSDLIRKMFYYLTNGNEDIAFYTNCMRNRDREKAVNNPVKFGIKLLGYNVFYRIPFVKKTKVHRKVGKDYLSKTFYTLPVVDLFSEMYSCDEIVCDVAESVFVQKHSKAKLYKMIGEKLGDKRFYKLRMKYDTPLMTLEEIYMKINHQLYTAFTYDTELEMISSNVVWNEYALRLLDIAVYNNIKVTLIISSCYSRKFILKLLEQGEIAYNSLYITSEEGAAKSEIAKKVCGKNTGVFSADFKGFIKPLRNLCSRKVYYANPSKISEKTLLPKLSYDFYDEFIMVTGLGLFSGIRHSSFQYELGYMCLGPLAYVLREKLKKIFGNAICYANEFSSLAMLCEDNNNIVFSDSGGISCDDTHYNVVNVGNDILSFGKFYDLLKKNNPDTTLKIIEAGDFLSQSSEPAKCLFLRNNGELSRGAVDFVNDYDEKSFSKSLTEKDADSLYCCGYSTLYHLEKASRSVVEKRISIPI